MLAMGMLTAIAGGQTTTSDSITGDWHLIGSNDDEVRVPQHRVDLRFHTTENGFRGAIVSHRDGSEIPLESVVMDGDTLRIRMGGPATLVLTRDGEKFIGNWTGSEIGLKLVRAR